ncbi:MAG: hypothetical protein ACI4RN_07445 [Oscillospiraceae bacterium]
MKLSKIFAGASAAVLMAAMAIPAAAGDGAPIGVIDKWELDGKKTLASRYLIGAEENTPYFEKNEQSAWDKLFTATTVRITVQGDYFGEDGWDASGSIVLNSTMDNWDQVDWQLGKGCYNLNDDGSIKGVNEEKNKHIAKIYVSDNKYTIEANLDSFALQDNLFQFEKEKGGDLSGDFASINVQSFNEDTTKGWNLIGCELLDSNGGEVYKEGEVALGDVYYADGKYNDGNSSSTADTNSNTTDASSAASTTSGDKAKSSTTSSSGSTGATSGTTSTTSASKSGSTTGSSSSKDTSANTGAASGLALAGIALAGTALVISKKRK